MATARRTRVCFSLASGRPRSEKTLPELWMTASLLCLPFAISRLVIFTCRLEPSRNHFHIRMGCLDTLGRLLLEGMQNVRSFLKLHRIHRPIGVAPVILNDLKNARAFALPRLRLRMLPAKLRDAQGDANLILHRSGKFQQVVLGGADPKEQLFAGSILQSRHLNYPSSRIFRQIYANRLLLLQLIECRQDLFAVF